MTKLRQKLQISHFHVMHSPYAIRQTNTAAKKAMVHRRRFLKICSLAEFLLYRILNNEDFKTEVEQTIFVSHLIITVQYIIDYLKIGSFKIWSNKFQMVMIYYSKLCASL